MEESKCFNLEQQQIIYDAVRNYQINCVTLNSKSYQICDEILNSLFDNVKKRYIEPAYRID